jgi:hypothetical protein
MRNINPQGDMVGKFTDSVAKLTNPTLQGPWSKDTLLTFFLITCLPVS